MKNYWRYIPNFLTVLRLPLAILSCYFALENNNVSMTISMLLFVAAGSTDYLDGYLARKWKIVSSFGKFVDPIADKVLILGVLGVFTYKLIVPQVFMIIIAFREILLTIIRTILVSKKLVLQSAYSGKVKTFSQGMVILALYFSVIFKEEILSVIGLSLYKYIILAMISWILIITVYSGVQFFIDNKRTLIRHFG